MSILRKIVSFVVLVASIVVIVAVCMQPEMNAVWKAFGAAFSPFDFEKLAAAIYSFFLLLGMPIILMMLGFIGISIPGKRK